MPEIRLELEPHGAAGRVARVTIMNAAKANCLNLDLTTRLRDRFRDLGRMDDLRLAVLTGAGARAFIGGADITELNALDAASGRRFITTLHQAATAIRDLAVPVIARINGWCLGAGMEVAAACDLRVAADDAWMGMPEVKVGVPSVIEAALLPRLIGWGKTAELVLTGEPMDARTAARVGYLQKVVARTDLDRAVEAWVASILAAGPRAVRRQKALMRRWEELPLDAAIAAGIESFAEAYQGDEPGRMTAAFMSRRR